jgi:hypothetical protein
MVSIYGGGSHPDSTRNIFRKAGVTPGASLAEVNVADYFQEEAAAGLWELWILCSRLSLLLEQCIAAAEPAYPGMPFSWRRCSTTSISVITSSPKRSPIA